MAHDESIVGRAAAILDAFDRAHSSIGLSDLARRSGLAKSTTHRLAEQLVTRGFMERVDGRYRLGVRLFELGQLVPRSRVLRDAALPFLEDLFVASRETIHLATQDGLEVLYIERIVGHASEGTPSEVAGRMPLHSTATGKAILAYLPAAEVDDYLSRPLRRFTQHTIVVPDVLRADLQSVRRTGWAVEREETVVGYVSVASAVFDSANNPIAALSVTGPSRRLDPERFGPAVRTAARGLARVLAGER